MYLYKLTLVIVLSMFSTLTLAQRDLSLKAIASMEEGLSVNEELLQFLQDRPCEFGFVTDCDRPLSVQDISKLKNLFKKLEVWNKNLFSNIIPNSDRLKGMPFEIEEGSDFSVREGTRFNPRILNFEKFLHVTLNAEDEDSTQFIQNVQIASASTLLMYDSFFKLSHVLAKAKKIRAILEFDLGTDGRILKDLFSNASNEENWTRTEINLAFLEKAAPSNFVVNYFDQYIFKSFTASKIKNNDILFKLENVLFIERMMLQTDFLNALERILGKLSQVFGNTVGQIQSRDGKLKARANDVAFMNSLKARLKPLDILLEKTPFRLTDHFIPGHYGHVAIWLGHQEEILNYKVNYQGDEILLLDHPEVSPYLEKMSLGKLIVEALRDPGVTMNTLEHFMDIDDFLVLRITDLKNPGEKILRTIQQVGKPYDFNFDVETENTIVCSELVYTVFNDQEWPLDRTIGRYTISPDHVAWKAIDSCLVPQVMFHDGDEVSQNMLGELKTLLSQRGGISYSPVGSCN